MVMKIFNMAFGKVNPAKTNMTTFVPKTVVQIFQNMQKTYYTVVKTDNNYTAKINALKTKFTGIDAEQYLAEAKTNGNRILQISDSDFETYGKPWDKTLAQVS